MLQSSRFTPKKGEFPLAGDVFRDMYICMYVYIYISIHVQGPRFDGLGREKCRNVLPGASGACATPKTAGGGDECGANRGGWEKKTRAKWPGCCEILSWTMTFQHSFLVVWLLQGTLVCAFLE